MVDPPRLRAVLERLERRRRRLDGYARLSVDEYLANPESVDASKYLLITAIEDAITAANHVIASQGFRTPEDYADAFRSLAEAQVLEPELAGRLQAMARFRNLLVHVYTEVDDRRVFQFLEQDLADLDQYIRALLVAFPEIGPPGA